MFDSYFKLLSLSVLQEKSIMFARWPELEGEVDEMLLKESDYLQAVSHEFRVRLKKMMEIREKVGAVTKSKENALKC